MQVRSRFVQELRNQAVIIMAFQNETEKPV